MYKNFTGIVACLLIFCSTTTLAAEKKSDSEIKQAIIAESIASYPSNCPCPYNSMRNGRSCGKRSAYSKPGGYSPICYDSDVTEKMIKAYKQRHRN